MGLLGAILLEVPALVFSAIVGVGLAIGEAGEAVYKAVSPSSCAAPASAGIQSNLAAKPSPIMGSDSDPEKSNQVCGKAAH
jgi:hypothetical protein